MSLNVNLELEERRQFIDIAASEIARNDNLTLDCSTVCAIDDCTIGMMVTIARCAARRGGRVELINVPPRLAQAITAAKIHDAFDWRETAPPRSSGRGTA